jgi:hypothetical protein
VGDVNLAPVESLAGKSPIAFRCFPIKKQEAEIQRLFALWENLDFGGMKQRRQKPVAVPLHRFAIRDIAGQVDAYSSLAIRIYYRPLEVVSRFPGRGKGEGGIRLLPFFIQSSQYV